MTDEIPAVEKRLNQLFIESRETKGLSLEEAAGQLNLSLPQMQKLESDALNPVELSTFERGYVRNYAALLGMEPAVFEGYLANYDYGYSDLHSVRRYSNSVNRPLLGRAILKWLFVLIVLGLISALVLFVF